MMKSEPPINLPEAVRRLRALKMAPLEVEELGALCEAGSRGLTAFECPPSRHSRWLGFQLNWKKRGLVERVREPNKTPHRAGRPRIRVFATAKAYELLGLPLPTSTGQTHEPA